MYKILVNAADRQNNIVTLIKTKEGFQETIDSLEGVMDIVETIKHLLIKNSLNISQITEFESFPGPGSFTGLKKSFAITNALNWSLNIKKDPTDFELPIYGKEPNIG